MLFPKGYEKTGGRRKNTPNKRTEEIRTHLIWVLGLSAERIAEDIKKMSTAESIQLWQVMLKHILPKYFPVAPPVPEASDEPVKIALTEEIVYRALSEEEIESGSWKND